MKYQTFNDRKNYAAERFSCEGDPKNFDWKKISVKNIEAEDNERLCDSETLF